MKGQWKCQIEKPPSLINVGDELIMSCDGDEPVQLASPLQIQPLNGDPYSLVALETVNIEKHFLALKFVSYRTGEFNSPFIITDGERELLIKDGISFHVQSVLGPKDALFGPIGPFKPEMLLGFSPVLGLSLFGAGLVFFIVFLIRLLKRKLFIRKVMKRGHCLQPDKAFVLALKSKKNLDQAELGGLFKAFLEDKFFVPALNLKTKRIIKKLKKEHPLIYKKDGAFVRRVLDELSYNIEPSDKETFLKLRKLTQEAVFHLSESNKL